MFGRRSRWVAVAVCAALAALLVMLSGFALIISHSQRDARRALTDRFLVRTSLTASFARHYVEDISGRERRQAERLLAGRNVDQATFEQVARALDFETAMLLDRDGRLLTAWPPGPELVGKDMTVGRAELRTAVVNRRVGVSTVARPGAREKSITALAVPYATPTGHRVLSGSLSSSTLPLDAYFSSVVTAGGGNAFLIDNFDNVLASAHRVPLHRGVLANVRNGFGYVDSTGSELIVSTAPVPGTPWRVVLTAPTATFFAPVANGRWAPWLLWCAFAAMSAVAMMLIVCLSRARRIAATTARTDMLTGLPNRRSIDEMLGRAVSYAKRHDLSLIALMIDLDHFKAVNDTHGHHSGDAVLQGAATRIREAIRLEDVVGRWGGEEFLVLLPHTSVQGGLHVAERIGAAIARASESGLASVTASIGLAELTDGTERLLRDADAALYKAKTAGRNRTAITASPTNPHQASPMSALK